MEQENKNTFDSLNSIFEALGPTLGLPEDSHYYDIFSFMADQTIVEVTTLAACPYSGFLDQELALCGELHLPEQHKIKLPLATASILHREKIVSLNKPDFLHENIIQALQRDPYVVNIAKLDPNFFEVGVRVAKLLDETQLMDSLCAAMAQRVVLLMNLAADEVNEELSIMKVGSCLSSEVQALKDKQNKKKEQNQMLSLINIAASSSQPVNIRLFLEGLSQSETLLYKRRKDELRHIMRQGLF